MHGLHHRSAGLTYAERPGTARPRDPLSIVLVVVIVAALSLAALLGAEVYVRHRATSALQKVVECVAGDRARVSVGTRPVLLQLMTANFPDIVIETAGNQFRKAKGTKVQVHIADLRLPTGGDSRGTLGSLDAEMSWRNDGIKQTLQDTIPLFGSLMTAVISKPSNGTIELQIGLSSITVRPQVANGGLAFRVLNVSGFGFTLPGESFQPQLDALTSTVMTNLPTGIRADSVQLTDTGVNARFSARHASFPVAQTDPCFSGL